MTLWMGQKKMPLREIRYIKIDALLLVTCFGLLLLGNKIIEK